MSNRVTPPEEFFGHQLGADKKIARWDKIVEYFNKLDEESNRIKVIDMGPSTEGNTFLAVYISSEENMANLSELQTINKQIADPGVLTEEEVMPLVEKGKAVAIQSMSLHATEIGGTQMAPELAYELITKEDEETRRIRDNVISIMVPCFNPDGQILVTDWYNETLGTEYEGVNQPFLYHKYTGHDNNRDAFMTNIPESQYMADLMFHQWPPQAYQDHHHMGSYGARLFVVPYSDPIHPHGDPLVWRELSWYGAHMAYKLEEADKTGIVNGAIFSGWAHMGFHWIGIYHNIPSMLTESASAKLATPLFIHPEQLKANKPMSMVGNRMFPNNNPSTLFPHPWEGGWWKLRDIVEQQKVSAWAILDHMARNKETVLLNQYHKAVRQAERGTEGPVDAFVIPAEQHDPLTKELMVHKLMVQNLKIYKAQDDFIVGNTLFGEGSYIIPLNQPKQGLAKTLLGRTMFPDDPWTRDDKGVPFKPYDTTTDTMFEFMGVDVDPVEYIPDVEMDLLEEHEMPVGATGESDVGFLLDGRLNASYKAVNNLLEAGVPVNRVLDFLDTGDEVLPPGSFLVQPGNEEEYLKAAEATGVDFQPLDEIGADVKPVKRLKVGMYQRYWGGNMDEGWTRLCLEQFNFPYTTLMDKDILEGDLSAYDVLILPHDTPEMITGGDELKENWAKNMPYYPMPPYPEKYQSGLGDEGKKKIKAWVENGGKLVCFGEASQYAIDVLGLKVKNVAKDIPTTEFYCPGSNLNIEMDVDHPVAYGMPEEAVGLFHGNVAFDILPSGDNHMYEVVATYPERDILESGWLIGEKYLAEKIAVLTAKKGKGEAVLIGIRCQHRCQTHGTFKLLFNSLLG